MKRGDIWIVAGGKDYAGKPRPVVVIQDDSFSGSGAFGAMSAAASRKPLPSAAAIPKKITIGRYCRRKAFIKASMRNRVGF